MHGPAPHLPRLKLYRGGGGAKIALERSIAFACQLLETVVGGEVEHLR